MVVTRAGGPGSPATASIRGSSANQVLVLVDGVPQNQAVSGSADLSLVRLDNVEKISVVAAPNRRATASRRWAARSWWRHAARPGSRPRPRWARAPTAPARCRAGRAWGGNTAGGVAASVSGAYNDFAGDFPYDIPPERGGGTGVRLNSAVRDVRSTVSVTSTVTAEARDGASTSMSIAGCRERWCSRRSRSPDAAAIRRGHRRKHEGRAGHRVGEPVAQRQDATFADSAPPFPPRTTTRTRPTYSWPTPASCAR